MRYLFGFLLCGFLGAFSHIMKVAYIAAAAVRLGGHATSLGISAHGLAESLLRMAFTCHQLVLTEWATVCSEMYCS
jgi:hypothetical protein